MERQFAAPYFLALAGIPVSAGLWAWSLNAAVDNLGLPVMHRSIYIFLAAAAVYLLLSLLCSLRTPCRSGHSTVFQYGRSGWICAAIFWAASAPSPPHCSAGVPDGGLPHRR